ncbi:hypothetical protein [Polaromonas sp.]|uniref:hypothetical protein n=1 Tax=Polaromonas sp. TaxID=1869339 RepID=UPI0017B17B6C|nr:hypothetical protein [Polaromonas sp.]NMM04778.1 hypothetical protein [Polaromonas sp.]
MKLAFTSALLLVLGHPTPCLAQTAPADGPAPKRQLIEQKIRLLDMLVNSPAARNAASGRDPESAALIEKGRKAFDAARQAFADSRIDEASRLLDEALKSTSAASRKISPDGSLLSESAQRKSLADMAEQVASYRASVVELTRDGKVGVAARQLLSQIDTLLSESKQLADAGRLGDANKKMASAYKLTVEEITKLRAGQEVFMSLKFDTPADEYVYEQKRFGSSLTMIDMMIGEGRAEGQKRKLVDSFVTEGNRLRSLAEAEADSQHHKEAVVLMEKASGQLNKALQSMGIPVF